MSLPNAGLDTTNSIKQAAEFGIVKSGEKLAGLLLTLAEVHGLGLEAAQGLVLTEGYYWDRDDKSRDLANRFVKRTRRTPNIIEAGTYSATLQILKAVKAAGTKDTEAVARKLKELPVDDQFATRRQGAGKRPHGARPLSVRGEEAVGVEEALRYYTNSPCAGRQGISVRQGFWLPAGERAVAAISRSPLGCRHKTPRCLFAKAARHLFAA